MTGNLVIALEPPKALPAAAEARLLEEAYARRPQSAALRRKLGKLLNQQDRFDETIALLAPSVDKLDDASALVLASACFARHDAGHYELARLASDQAVTTATNDAGRARAMADQAKLRLRIGLEEEALAILRVALRLDPRCIAAFKRLALQLLRQGDFDQVERLTSGLITDGISHARVLSARTMALAAMGRIAEAQRVAGLEQFLDCAPITPPPGWESLDQFNAALVAELTDSSALRLDRFGTASILTWRLDSPTAGATPLWQMLLQQIARSVESWSASHAAIDHAWLAARPERALLRSWCVITGTEGHESWHMHPDGWLSGGYYPLVPTVLLQSEANAGCLALGLPDGLPGARAARRFGEVTVRPEAGMLTLFPSHAYHRTYPHGTAEQRICVAFDVVPA